MNYLKLWAVNLPKLVPAFVRLLRDNEAEVRIAATGKVTKFSLIFKRRTCNSAYSSMCKGIFIGFFSASPVCSGLCYNGLLLVQLGNQRDNDFIMKQRSCFIG